MKLTPVDIKNQQFKIKMRGYDSQEVHTFLDLVSVEVDEFHKEYELLKSRLFEKEEEVLGLRESEERLMKTIYTIQELKEKFSGTAEKTAAMIKKEAELNASSLVSSAQTKAETLLREAETRAERIIAHANDDEEKLIGRISDLKVQKKQMEINFRNLLTSYLKLLDMESQNDKLEKELTVECFTQ